MAGWDKAEPLEIAETKEGEAGECAALFRPTLARFVAWLGAAIRLL
jgi:hypothetical protein